MMDLTKNVLKLLIHTFVLNRKCKFFLQLVHFILKQNSFIVWQTGHFCPESQVQILSSAGSLHS